MSEKTKVVNTKIRSVDGKGIMMGRRAYTNDFTPENPLGLKGLRSPHAFAKIKSIDTTEASRIPGVECILTYKDFKRNAHTRAGQGYPEPSPHDKFALDSMVRYIGDEVAVVAASNEPTAQEALSKIKVDYEVLDPVFDFEKAKDHEPLVHPEEAIYEMFPIGFDPKRNLAASYHMEVGDVQKTLDESDVLIEHAFYTQAQAHTAMEPHTVNAHIDVQNRLTLYTSTQTPFHVRRIIAQVLEVPLSQIRIIKPRVGGVGTV